MSKKKNIDVIIIRPMSHTWDSESYMRMITIPHGPLALAAGLIKNNFNVEIIDEVCLTTELSNQKLKATSLTVRIAKMAVCLLITLKL